ncbi:MAG: hypothetical protein ACN6QT_16970, partial [Burkholderia contaminans]
IHEQAVRVHGALSARSAAYGNPASATGSRADNQPNKAHAKPAANRAYREIRPRALRVRHQENPDSGTPRPFFCVAARVATDAIRVFGCPYPGWPLPPIQHGFQTAPPVKTGMVNSDIQRISPNFNPCQVLK